MPSDSSAVFPTKVSLSALADTTTERVQLLAGTGAMWTWVPVGVLRNLRIVPKGVARFRTLGGHVVEREYADARIACLQRDCPSLVVFAVEGDQNTLGDHALLCMGLKVDAGTQSLTDAGPALALAAVAAPEGGELPLLVARRGLGRVRQRALHGNPAS